MDGFMYRFARGHDEEISDYNLRFEKEVYRAEQVAGELAPTWKAHLFLSKMRWPEAKVPLVLTGALGKYSVAALRDAAIATFPSASSIRGGDHRPPGSSGGYPTKHHKGRFRNKEHAAHEVAPDKDKQDDDAQSSGHSSEEVPGQEPDEDDALPDELEEDLKESFAYMTQAKKRRSEAEKARAFFEREPIRPPGRNR